MQLWRMARRNGLAAEIDMRLPATFMVCVIVTFLDADTAGRALAQTTSDPKVRCAELIEYYDRYGASRSENSDGARNMTRIGAGIDCNRGRYDQGIKTMEDLLPQKKLTVPPAQ